jgi:hypothetical protein
MSDDRSENSEDVETLSESVWADGIEGIMQPDRKKGKSGGRLTSRFVWTDAVSAVV